MFKLIGAVILLAVIYAICDALIKSGILTVIGIAIAAVAVVVIGIKIYTGIKRKKADPEKPEPASIAPHVSVRVASGAEETALLKSFKARVAGVSFDNEDGSSRQDILRCIYESGKKGEVTFEPYFYKDEQACYVYVDYECIGNIPKKDAERFVENLDRIKSANVKVEEFTGRDDNETKYRADVFVKYN